MAGKKDDFTAPPATNDAYTGMLAIALLALIGGCVFLYLDYSQYPDSKPPAVPKAPGIAVQGGAPVQKAPKEAPPKEALPKEAPKDAPPAADPKKE